MAQQSRKNYRRWINIGLGVIISGFFLWLALRGIDDWGEVGAVLQTAEWSFIPVVFAVWALALAARAVRWRVMLGGRVSLWKSFHVLNIGFLFNTVLPLRAGEFARAYLIGRDEADVSAWAAVSTIVAERLLDVFATVVILALVLTVLPVESGVIIAALGLLAAAIFGFGLLMVFAHRPAWAHAFLNFFLRLLPPLKRLGLDALLDRILDGLQPLTTWRGLVGSLVWTGISWFFSVLGSWALGQVFPELIGLDLAYAALALSVVAASFSIIIPLTIASTGPFHLATIFALQSTVSASSELAATYALVWHAGTVINYAVWGVIGLLSLGLSVGQVQEETTAFSEEADSGEQGAAVETV